MSVEYPQKDQSALHLDAADKALGEAPKAQQQQQKYVGCFCSTFTGPDSAPVRNLPKVVVRGVPLRSGRGAIGLATFEPGWKWSEHLKPIVKTELCAQSHFGLVLEGEMAIVMKDGTEKHMKAGDAFYIPPQHDGWVVGNSSFVCVDVGFETYGILQSDEEAKKQAIQHSNDLDKLGLQIKSFSQADESRELPLAKLDIVKFGPYASIGRLTQQPGWKWSTHVKPIVGTEFCEHSHMGIATKGKHTIFMKESGVTITMDSSKEVSAFECEPQHDGWIEGEEGGIIYDITPAIKHYGEHKH